MDEDTPVTFEEEIRDLLEAIDDDPDRRLLLEAQLMADGDLKGIEPTIEHIRELVSENRALNGIISHLHRKLEAIGWEAF
jgi:hypothetical protein